MIEDLSLPEFAFLDDYNNNGKLTGRNVILHVRTASVVEILEKENVLALNDNVVRYDFDFVNKWGVVEHYVAALHYCATLDSESDVQMIIDNILSPAADWFTEYMDWEDENIISENKENTDKFTIVRDTRSNDLIVRRNRKPFFTVRAEKGADLKKLAKGLKACAEFLTKIVGYGRE